MKKLVLFAAMPIMAFSLLTFTSCEKLVEDASETADSAEDFSEDQEAMSELVTLVQDVASTDPYMLKKSNSILPPGSVTYIDSSFTDGDGMEVLVVLADPTSGTDGTYRQGYLTITANKPFSEVGCIIEVIGTLGASNTANMLAGYGFSIDPSRNSFKIERTAENKLTVKYSLDLYYVITSWEDNIFIGDHYMCTGNFVLTQTEGLQTPGTDGDKFALSGSSTGENHNQTPYTTTISKDLVYVVDKTCSKTFTEGEMTLKNDGSSSDLKLDFGTGACDNDVVITLPGGIKKTYTVN